LLHLDRGHDGYHPRIPNASFRLQLGHIIWPKILHPYSTKMLDTGLIHDPFDIKLSGFLSTRNVEPLAQTWIIYEFD